MRGDGAPGPKRRCLSFFAIAGRVLSPRKCNPPGAFRNGPCCILAFDDESATDGNDDEAKVSTRSIFCWREFAFSELALLRRRNKVTRGEKEQRIFELTNQDRAAQGLQPLRWDSALAAAADVHVDKMKDEKELSHQYPGEPD